MLTPDYLHPSNPGWVQFHKKNVQDIQKKIIKKIIIILFLFLNLYLSGKGQYKFIVKCMFSKTVHKYHPLWCMHIVPYIFTMLHTSDDASYLLGVPNLSFPIQIVSTELLIRHISGSSKKHKVYGQCSTWRMCKWPLPVGIFCDGKYRNAKKIPISSIHH